MFDFDRFDVYNVSHGKSTVIMVIYNGHYGNSFHFESVYRLYDYMIQLFNFALYWQEKLEQRF